MDRENVSLRKLQQLKELDDGVCSVKKKKKSKKFREDNAGDGVVRR